MNYIKICSLVIVGVVLISLIPAKDKSINTVISISISLSIILYILSVISPYIDTVKSILITNKSNDFDLIIKIIGISVLSQLVCDFALENGNKALSSAITLAGNVTIAFLAMPIYIKVFEIIGQLIK